MTYFGPLSGQFDIVPVVIEALVCAGIVKRTAERNVNMKTRLFLIFCAPFLRNILQIQFQLTG
jgi:hypothetical protein